MILLNLFLFVTLDLPHLRPFLQIQRYLLNLHHLQHY
jgi:hypothetical protein